MLSDLKTQIRQWSQYTTFNFRLWKCTSIMILFGPPFSAKCVFPSKTVVLLCILSTVNLHVRVHINQKWCLIWKAWIVHGEGMSSRRSQTGKPCWVAKAHFGLKAWYGWQDYVFPLSPIYIFTSPQTLLALASLDPPPRKPFLLLGRTLLPLRASTHTEDMGQVGSCTAQLSCRICKVLSHIRRSLLCFSGCLKSVKNEGGAKKMEK